MYVYCKQILIKVSLCFLHCFHPQQGHPELSHIKRQKTLGKQHISPFFETGLLHILFLIIYDLTSRISLTLSMVIYPRNRKLQY